MLLPSTAILASSWLLAGAATAAPAANYTPKYKV